MRLSTKRGVVVGLVVVASLALVLPTAWTGRFVSLIQIIVPFQHAATSAANSLGEDRVGDGNDSNHAARVNAALEHRVAALSARVAELEREVAILTATRLWDVGGGRIGARGRLIPASVVVGDLLPWRSSKLINAGSLQGVPRGAPVVSNHFTIGLDAKAGVRNGLAVLLGETLIGWIEQAPGTHVSRVKLVSDPTVEMKVHIGRVEEGGFSLAEGYYWLTGRGRGRMEIRDVNRDLTQDGMIKVGDLVLSDPANPVLPAAMTVGKVAEIRPDRENPLLSILTVEPAVDPGHLRRVYVYDPEGEEQG